MELTDLTRSQMVNSIKDEIEGGASTTGKFEFYDKSGTFIVALALNYPCMTIVNGVGTFDDTTPYLKGTVQPGNGGLANRWAFKDSDDKVVLTGTVGDAGNTDKDIVFNERQWNDYDNISITGLTLTVPTGSNDYVPD